MMRAGGKAAGDGPFIDGLTTVQVERTAGLSTDELIDRLEAAGPVAARWRARRRLMRLAPMKQDPGDGTIETWRMGYLVDIILTRDTWMHRSDLAVAVGTPMTLTSGPAGGRYRHGSGGEEITIDAVEFCRILSGRGSGDGLLGQPVPF